MTFAQGFYDFFRACTLFDKKNPLNFNYRDVKPTQYNIDAPPSGNIIQRYMSGTTIREKLITIGSVESYGEDARVQIHNSGFYEELAAWIEKQNDLKNFPKTPDGIIPIKLECLTDGYLMSTDTNIGWYQIQLKLTYKQGGKR